MADLRHRRGHSRSIGLTLAFKFFRVRRNHYYRLTTRRLFLTTGLFHRRVDQVELVRIKDLFVRQNLISAWLDVGTVILISSEADPPQGPSSRYREASGASGT